LKQYPPGQPGEELETFREHVLLHDHHLVDSELLLEGQLCNERKKMVRSVENVRLFT
jgi:hypothetical protein